MNLIVCLSKAYRQTFCPKECLRMTEWFIECFIEQEYEKNVYIYYVLVIKFGCGMNKTYAKGLSVNLTNLRLASFLWDIGKQYMAHPLSH